MIHEDARKLVTNLRQVGMKEDAIYSRLVAEGFSPYKAERIMKLAAHRYDKIRQGTLLTAWLTLHIIIIVLSIPLLTLMLFWSASNPPMFILFGLLLADACIQLWFINELRDNNLNGFYGLMVLFILRFILMPPLNLIDALFLCFAVYSSRKSDTRKRKRKVKTI